MARLKFQKISSNKEIHHNLTPSLVEEVRDYFWYFARLFFIVILVYFVIRTNIFDVIAIRGQSMYPTFNEKTKDDAIYIDQLTPKFGDYRRGDVIVVIAPKECDTNRSYYIKRVIGLPGEQVAFEDGKVYIINDKYPSPGIQLNESNYLRKDVSTYKNINQDDGRRFEEKRLGKDEYFFMGDNRTGSSDSRLCGPISKNEVLGREYFRVSPSEKSGLFKLVKYNIGNQ